MVSGFSALSAKIESWAARREFASFVSILEPNSTDVILGAGYGWVLPMSLASVASYWR